LAGVAARWKIKRYQLLEDLENLLEIYAEISDKFHVHQAVSSIGCDTLPEIPFLF